jgi:hypothetical protein
MRDLAYKNRVNLSQKRIMSLSNQITNSFFKLDHFSATGKGYTIRKLSSLRKRGSKFTQKFL